MKAIRIAGRVTISALLVLAVAYVTFDVIQPDLTARFFGFKNYVILSGSMEPELSRGDVILVSRADPAKLAVGDVVAVRPQGHAVVAHEIAALDEDGPGTLRTRHQAAESREDWDYWKLNDDHVLGKMRFVIPVVGHAILFLKTPIGAVTIGLLFILMIVYRKIKNGIEILEAIETTGE